jgi:hypothetical protein
MWTLGIADLPEDPSGGQLRVDELEPACFGPDGPFLGRFPDPLRLGCLAISTPIVFPGRVAQSRSDDGPFGLQVNPAVEQLGEVQIEHVVGCTEEHDVRVPS